MLDDSLQNRWFIAQPKQLILYLKNLLQGTACKIKAVKGAESQTKTLLTKGK